MTAILLEANGTIRLPRESLKRYGFEHQTPVRLIETNEGILLVPLHNAPMTDELKQEIAEWQEAGGEVWNDFAFETK